MDEFYGQFETDKYIARYFPSDYVGTCIEVGAAHGTVSSNTLYFEKRGWKCLCIEPNPSMYSQLVRNRKITANYAVSDYNQDDVDFNIVVLPNGDESAISGLELDYRLLNSHTVIDQRVIKVNVRTLDSIIDEFNFVDDYLDFVSIDTEGTEQDVLEGFNINKYKPKLFVIENNFSDVYIQDYLRNYGYRIDLVHSINQFYIRCSG